MAFNFPEPPPRQDLLDAPSGCIRDVRGRLEQVVGDRCKLFRSIGLVESKTMVLKVASWSS